MICLAKLRVVNFNYIEAPERQEIGLIAEEVADIYPELIAYDVEQVPYTVRYKDLIPILLQKIQQLETIIYGRLSRECKRSRCTSNSSWANAKQCY